VLVFILIVQAIGYGLFGLVRNPYLATGVGFVDGVFNGFFFVMFTSILQLSTPSDIRGRVFGILATLSGILTPVALGLAGVVADLIDKNIPVIYFTSGIIMTVIIVIVSFNADFRGYLSQNFEENRDDQELETVSAQ
jgi:MFS family permease